MAKILIVDDNQDLLDLLNLRLTEKGHIVYIKNTKKELLEALKTVDPDLILLDVFLDKDDGREICKKITENSLRLGIPIILISGNSRALDNFKTFGAIAAITKPIIIDELLEKMAPFIPGNKILSDNSVFF